MKNNIKHFKYILILLLCSCQFKTNTPNNKNTISIRDMYGRVVQVPSEINKIFGSDVTTTLFVNALAPKTLVGKNFPLSEDQKEYLSRDFQNLPVLGFIFYGKSTLNLEKLAAAKPDILLCPVFKHTTHEYIRDFESYGKKLNIPIVMVSLELQDLPRAFEFMGKLLHKTDEADSLADYCIKTYAWMDSLKPLITQPKSVYVAEGTNGLHTIPALSTHSEIIEYCGLKNCAVIDEEFGYKDMQINMEQLINWQPENILISNRSAINAENKTLGYLKNDKAWQLVHAVKNNHISVVPALPYSWIGRPPSINRLLGIKWLTATLYPDIAPINMHNETKKFYQLFYHINLTSEQIKRLSNL